MRNKLTLSCVAVLTLIATTGLVRADLLKDLQNTMNKTVSPTGAANAGSSDQLGVSKITEGLKEALKVGTERVVDQLGAAGGYTDDPEIHIPLPEKMQQAQSLLGKFGLSGMADDVENRLNKGAEAAAPQTKALFLKAISDMSVEDAKKIYEGPDDAATQYFRKVATPELKETVRPIIDQSLEDVGAIAAYEKLMGEYKQYPLVPNIQSDLSSYATEQALEGLFHYLATEEAAIRNDPIKRTTEILQSVFGG